ncbi:MAG: hypothetical protein KDB10_07310, partial [Acidimicrobiales bacterium]|nr:hypothetical protein [Acidimicrobiales bacterium]
QAVQKQNEAAAAEGKPPVKAEPLVALAEQLLPRLRTAEWRDRAEAAKADLDELDLRDLRSVIVAADTGARDDESRALADELRTALNRRVEAEHAAWLAEIASTLAEGRCVRALRLSSRPPKAGAPLPTDMAARLAEATAASLTAEVTQDRWATVLDALAFSPVRLNVVPESLPANPSEALLTEIARLANQIPQIATVFGVEPASSGKRPRPRPPRGDRKPGRRVPPPPPKERADTAADASAAATGDDGADSGDATAPPPPAADAVGADPAAVTPDGTAAEDETAPEAPSGGPGAGAEAPDDGATEPAAAPDDAPDPGEGADATAADPTESFPPPPAPAASGATSSDAGPQDADTATGADDAAGADAEPTDA